MSKITPILESATERIVKKTNSSKKVLNKASTQKVLEKQPVVDLFDLTMEESGKYRFGDRIISIIFPR